MTVLPEMLLNHPAGHGVQEEEPGDAAMYPMGQSEQDDAGLMVELRYVLVEQFCARGRGQNTAFWHVHKQKGRRLRHTLQEVAPSAS